MHENLDCLGAPILMDYEMTGGLYERWVLKSGSLSQILVGKNKYLTTALNCEVALPM